MQRLHVTRRRGWPGPIGERSDAVALAARGERFGLATLLVGIPILSNLFNELAFLIGVMIYGF